MIARGKEVWQGAIGREKRIDIRQEENMGLWREEQKLNSKMAQEVLKRFVDCGIERNLNRVHREQYPL